MTARRRSREAESYPEPVVGVLLDTGSLTPEGPAWRVRYDSVEAEARQAGVLPLFLEIGGIDPVAGTASGCIRKDGAWLRATLPMPEVIYHRATFPIQDDRKAAAAVLEDICLRWSTWLLNCANAFSKSEVAEALSFFPETAAFTPETALLSSRDVLVRMLERHGPVFAKANYGSHGSDVLRITRSSPGWFVEGKFGGHAVSERFEDLNQLWRFFALIKGTRQWVLQQGIMVPEEEGRVFDVRAIAQKDGWGEWQVPLVLVRRSRPGSVAANMSQGGEPLLPGRFLEQFGHVFPWLRGFEQRVQEAAIRTAEALESRFGLLGEVGVDLGFDREGRPWVFEANTKPLHPALPDLPKPLKRLPFQYARFLAERARLGRTSGLAAPVG